jgi:hypothetical protein
MLSRCGVLFGGIVPGLAERGGATMNCPYCAEEIKAGAIVCPVCRRDLIFYKPLNERLAVLEKKVDQLIASVVKLEEAVPGRRPGAQPAAPARGTLSFQVAALLVGGMVATGSYALYLWTHATTDTLFLWISILTPLVTGVWIGLVSSPDRGLRNYVLTGAAAGVLNSAGICIALSIYLSEGRGIDWQKVLFLYFLTPFFLITFGSLVGDWLRHQRPGRREPPVYARSLAMAIAKPTDAGGEDEDRLERLTKLSEAVAPLLVFIASLVSAWLTYLAASR